MQIVVDANPLISFLIKPGKAVELLFLEEIELVAPELLFEEIENNKDLIVQKSGLTKEEIEEFLEIIKERIVIIPGEEFVRCREEAERICPDEKDIAYFSLALYLKCSVWSNEKKLKEQEHVKVYATHELMKLFSVK